MMRTSFRGPSPSQVSAQATGDADVQLHIQHREPSLEDCDADACWICLGEATSEKPLVVPCKCKTRPVHTTCLALWQLHALGRSEERNCRFCHQAYPDWRDSLSLQGVRPCRPTMALILNGKVVQVQIPSHLRGEEQFKAHIKKIFNLPEEMELDVTFDFKVPGTGQRVQLNGLKALPAAIHCASLSAGQRAARKAAQKAQRQAQGGAAASSSSSHHHHHHRSSSSSKSVALPCTSSAPLTQDSTVAASVPVPHPQLPVAAPLPPPSTSHSVGTTATSSSTTPAGMPASSVASPAAVPPTPEQRAMEACMARMAPAAALPQPAPSGAPPECASLPETAPATSPASASAATAIAVDASTARGSSGDAFIGVADNSQSSSPVHRQQGSSMSGDAAASQSLSTATRRPTTVLAAKLRKLTKFLKKLVTPATRAPA